MSKSYKVVDTNLTSTSGRQSLDVDWTQCVLCQQDTEETLICPGFSRKQATGAGYKTLADSLLAFDRIDRLPKTINLSSLDEGEGIESSFRCHNASWHDTCRLQYNKTKLQRAEKRKPSRESSPLKKYLRHNKGEKTPSEKCFFCDESAEGKTLHNVSTFQLDACVRQCAYKLENKPLLAKLSSGDLIAQEGKYHAECLASLYNKARNLDKSTEDRTDAVNHGLGFAGIVSYIEEIRLDERLAPIFKLSELTKLYTKRLEQLGTTTTVRVHSTKIKDRILSYFSDMEAHKHGRDVVFVYNKDIGEALHKACEHDNDNEAITLSRAASIVRRGMLKMKLTFNG